MAKLEISDVDFANLRDSVALVTGGSSGIGLATAQLLLSQGVSVVIGDLIPPPISHPSLVFLKTDVTSWTDLSTLFKHAEHISRSIDHVFANAGISGRTTYLDEHLDHQGNLTEPSFQTLDVNLKAVINTTALALHYMRRQISGGSIVITASASSYQRFRVVDYAAAKHGVLGFMRGMVPNLKSAGHPIRINAVAPSWTRTGIVPEALLAAVGVPSQAPEVVARSVALLMADGQRQGEVIYSDRGQFWEIEESILLPAAETVRTPGADSEDETVGKMKELVKGYETNEAEPGKNIDVDTNA